MPEMTLDERQSFADVCEQHIGAARVVTAMLELGDNRLLASDGPVGGQLPDLSPDEWGKVYRACKRIASNGAALTALAWLLREAEAVAKLLDGPEYITRASNLIDDLSAEYAPGDTREGHD